MDKLYTSLLVQKFAGEMQERIHPDGRIGNLARPFLGICNEIGKRVIRRFLACDDKKRLRPHDAKHLKVVARSA
jgi:hypothetical protein